MAGSVLECTGSYFSLPDVEKKMVKKSTFFPCLTTPFSVVSCSMVVVQESVFQCNARVIEQDAWTETEKALRVRRAVNIG